MAIIVLCSSDIFILQIERLQLLLADPDITKFNFTNFDPLPLPLHPEVKVCGIRSEKATIFKSALMPAKFTFQTIDNGSYTLMCKNGDDLRQDQLIQQMVMLMDKVSVIILLFIVSTCMVGQNSL